MDLDDLDKTYVCSSATWSILVRADSPEEAAGKALQKHMETSASFNIEACISVSQVVLNGDMITVDSSSVLADLGFHDIAKKLTNAIKSDR